MDKDEKEFEDAVEMATFIRGSLRWRAAYFLMRFLLVIEGVIWSVMDLVRGWRMKVAARINDNYKRQQ